MHNLFLELFMRWLHIGGACVLIGSPIFMRLFLWPAMNDLDIPARKAFVDRINKTWRNFLGVVILTQLISGIYWLLVVVDLPREPAIFQILLTVKLMAAMALFFLLSVLAGRAKVFELFRMQARRWLTICIFLGLLIAMCAGAMWLVPLKAPTPRQNTFHKFLRSGSATTQ